MVVIVSVHLCEYICGGPLFFEDKYILDKTIG